MPDLTRLALTVLLSTPIAILTTNTSLAQSANPSFSCAKARTQDEIVICTETRLSELDQAVAISFDQVEPKDKQQARSVANEALVARRLCGTDKLCILDQQVNAIISFSELGSIVPVPPWVGAYRLDLFRTRGDPATRGLPDRIAQCTITKIASISTRFGEELKPPTSDSDSSGSAVSYSNKGYQVSYSYVQTIAESHIGDEVLLCLASIPKDCPPGDDRGKIYSATNLRTKNFWVLPDAQHMCGGA